MMIEKKTKTSKRTLSKAPSCHPCGFIHWSLGTVLFVATCLRTFGQWQPICISGMSRGICIGFLRVLSSTGTSGRGPNFSRYGTQLCYPGNTDRMGHRANTPVLSDGIEHDTINHLLMAFFLFSRFYAIAATKALLIFCKVCLIWNICGRSPPHTTTCFMWWGSFANPLPLHRHSGHLWTLHKSTFAGWTAHLQKNHGAALSSHLNTENGLDSHVAWYLEWGDLQPSQLFAHSVVRFHKYHKFWAPFGKKPPNVLGVERRVIAFPRKMTMKPNRYRAKKNYGKQKFGVYPDYTFFCSFDKWWFATLFCEASAWSVQKWLDNRLKWHPKI